MGSTSKYRKDGIVALKNYFSDCPLNQIAYEEIRTVINRICSRPISPLTKKQISVATAENQIGCLLHFFQWAKKTKRWTNGTDIDEAFSYNSKALKKQNKNDDGSEKEKRVFSIDELKTIWRSCRHDNAKLYVLLALNCAMGQTEIATLRKGHILFDAFNSNGKWTPFIQRDRHKTEVPCRYRLWKETAVLLKRCLAETNAAGENGSDLALLAYDSKSLVRFDTDNNRIDRINEVWRYLCKVADRLTKTEGLPGVAQPRGFYSLRKTAANMIQQLSGNPHLAQVFMAQERQSVAEKHYLNRDYALLGKTLLQMRKRLQPMFDAGDFDSKQLKAKAEQLEKQYRTAKGLPPYVPQPKAKAVGAV